MLGERLCAEKSVEAPAGAVSQVDRAEDSDGLQVGSGAQLRGRSCGSRDFWDVTERRLHACCRSRPGVLVAEESSAAKIASLELLLSALASLMMMNPSVYEASVIEPAKAESRAPAEVSVGAELDDGGSDTGVLVAAPFIPPSGTRPTRPAWADLEDSDEEEG